MANADPCRDCFDPKNGVLRSPPTPSRSEALAFYIRLQRQGFLPAMCQNADGSYRVCHSEKERQ